MPTEPRPVTCWPGLSLCRGKVRAINLVLRVFGRELLAVSAWIDPPPAEEPVHAIGFAAGELA